MMVSEYHLQPVLVALSKLISYAPNFTQNCTSIISISNPDCVDTIFLLKIHIPPTHSASTTTSVCTGSISI